MSKYTDEFKLAVVEQYLGGATVSIQKRSSTGALLHELRKWLGLFRLHGANGLRKKFSHYDADFKLELEDVMLKKALAKLKMGEKPILHSDQGWQYRMPAYKMKLKGLSPVQYRTQPLAA